jgi:hypothetical protein
VATKKKPAKPEAPVFQQVFKAVDDLLRKDGGLGTGTRSGTRSQAHE